MRFTLDTNILVYAVDRAAGKRHNQAVALIHRLPGRDCVLTLQSLAELFCTLTSAKQGIPPARAADIVQQWRDKLPVVAADNAYLTDAINAVTHHGWSFLGCDDLGDSKASRVPAPPVGRWSGRSYAGRSHHHQPVCRWPAASS